MCRVYMLHYNTVNSLSGGYDIKQKRTNKKLLSVVFFILVIVSGLAAAGHLSNNNTQIKNNVENYLLLEKETHSAPLNLYGNTLYVGGSGPDNYTRIQDAIDNTTNGDTVFVFDDSSPYVENLIANKSIQLLGESKETTVINGNESGDVVTISSDHATISGFTIEDSGDDYSNHDAGIKLLSNENIITNTYITHNREGVYLSSSNSNNISNNSVNYNRNAIQLHDASTHNRISGNTIITWSSSFGVYIENSSDNNMIFQNTITNPDGWALYILESQENNISDNTVMKSEYGISMVYSNDSIISNNFLKQNEYSGISLTGSRGNVISQNTFEFDGLFIWNSYHNTVSDNTVNGKPLIYFEDESDMTVPGNAGQIILVNCNNILIENQDIKDTSVGIELWYSDNCEISRNILTHNKGNIYLRNANYTRINQNTLISNKSYTFRHSLELRECVGNSITQNDFSSTVEYQRLFIYNSHYNNISGNNFSDEFNGVSICHHSSSHVVDRPTGDVKIKLRRQIPCPFTSISWDDPKARLLPPLAFSLAPIISQPLSIRGKTRAFLWARGSRDFPEIPTSCRHGEQINGLRIQIGVLAAVGTEGDFPSVR